VDLATEQRRQRSGTSVDVNVWGVREAAARGTVAEVPRLARHEPRVQGDGVSAYLHRARSGEPGGGGVYTLKIYAYEGTPEEKILVDIAAGMGPTRRLYFHGLFTYDYFAIVRTLRAPDRVTWLDPPAWTRVAFPLAFVTFGEASTPEDAEQ
jgi:hypothetical protein